VCVIDDNGRIVKHWLVQDTTTSDNSLPSWSELAEPTDLPIAIERSRGLIIGLFVARWSSGLDAEPTGFNAPRPCLGDRYEVQCQGRLNAGRLGRHLGTRIPQGWNAALRQWA
jgi:hypothetical protein